MLDSEKRNFVCETGSIVLNFLEYLGNLSILLMQTISWLIRGLFTRRAKISYPALSKQLVRIGIKSLLIVALVQLFIGAILALQIEPVLRQYGQEKQLASVIGTAGFRMLGPIFTAVVLSGFAGASIAAELGTMVVSEEIEAMKAMALNPVRFLVVPRVAMTTLAMLLLTTFADVMIAVGGYLVGRYALGANVYHYYWQLMQRSLKFSDYYSGLTQGFVFGLLIGLIACHEGLSVKDGAAAVGRATTMTVVYSIVAIVVAACICTIGFYLFQI